MKLYIVAQAADGTQYNGLNWRTVKGGAPLGTLNRKRYGYYSANWQLLQEDIDDPLDQGQTIDKRIQYLWGLRYIDDIILHREDSNVNGTYDKTWYHLTDAQFSTVAIVDENAHLAERVTYSAYGEARHHWAADVNGDGAVTNDDRTIIHGLWNQNGWTGTRIHESGYRAEADLNRDGVINEDDYDLSATLKAALGAGTLSSSDVQNIVGYAGYLFNGDIRGVDQYHVRHRVYDVGLGRWITRDPIGFVDGMNLYEYGLSSPLGNTDPTGLTAAGRHHPYPQYLGGHPTLQPRFPLSAENHQAAHRYFAEKGFDWRGGNGDAARANWQALTPRQRKAHVMNSLRRAGVSNSWISQNIDKVMSNDLPGTNRSPSAARRGFVTTGMIRAMAGSALVVAGATLGYDIYISSSNKLGEFASRINLCKEIQDADRDMALTGDMKHPDNFMYISRSGVTYEVQAIGRNGCCYFTAKYRLVGGTDDFMLHPDTTYKCPANLRDFPQCKGSR